MKLAAAQLNFTIGDLQGNYEKIRGVYIAQKSSGVDGIVFSELALTGYPPNDLLQRRGFVEQQLELLDDLRKLTLNETTALIVGAVTLNEGKGKPLYNSALVFQNGEEIFRYNKQLLPTYNIFDENRYFEAGNPEQDNTFRLYTPTCNAELVGILICEDAWNDEAVTDAPLYPTNPVKDLADRKPRVIVTLNASPSHVGKNLERYEMYKTLVERYNIPILYVNQVGANDALIFDGYSFLVIPSRHPSKKGVPHPISSLGGFRSDYGVFDIEEGGATPLNKVDLHNNPAFPDADALGAHLVLGIRDYVHKNGFKQVVIGESGGIDSAVVTGLAVMALGPYNVKAITMPSKVSSEGSVSDSEELCKTFGVQLFNRSIREEVDLSIENFKEAFGVEPSRLTIENEQARIRGRILMEYSNHFGALVLSTGNKSEMSVGYCTIYGDMCGGLAVIADTYKMEVYELAKFINYKSGQDFIPQAIIDKAPSAELWEEQKDTDSLPPYPVLDAILRLYLERDLLSKVEIAKYTALCEKLTLAEIKRILQMTDRAEFKRQQAPPVLRVHRRAFGFGRNLPITQKFGVDYRNVL